MAQTRFLEQFKEQLKRLDKEDGLSYSDVAYADTLHAEPQAINASTVGFIEEENYFPIVDCLIYIQGVELGRLIKGSVSWQLSDVAGNNTCSFDLSNEGNELVLTPQNFTFNNLSDALGMNLNEPLVNFDAPAFNDLEQKKKKIFEYKINPDRNPLGFMSDGSTFFTRYPLAPNTSIVQKMDPVRVFVPVPHFPIDRLRNDEPYWVPVFTGYVNNVTIEDDWVNGPTHIHVECADFRTMILRGMRIAFDATVGITSAADQAFGAPVTVLNEARDVRIAEENVNFQNSFFSDTISASVSGQPFVGRSLPEAVGELLLGQTQFKTTATLPDGQQIAADVNPNVPPTGATANTQDALTLESRRRVKGIQGVRDAGIYRYDSEGSKNDRRAFLEEWHRVALFGPKRRPWTTIEVSAVGEETTSDGIFAPNNISLWRLMPQAGSGPNNLADVQATQQPMSNDVNWNTRDDVLKQLIESIDYQFFVSGCGDLFLEFPMMDFSPSDYGEFSTVLAIGGHLSGGTVADEQGEVPCGVLGVTGFGVGATANGGASSNRLVKAFAWSPSIANRLGVRVQQRSFPFLVNRQLPQAAQLAAVELQKLIGDANTFALESKYRPFITPNRPVEYVRRTRIGKSVSVVNSVTLSQSAKGDTTITSNHVRKWTGFIDGDGERIYETIGGGRATPLSTKIGYGPGQIAATSGIYTNPNINDLATGTPTAAAAAAANALTEFPPKFTGATKTFPQLDPKFVEALNAMLQEFGEDIYVTSAVRSLASDFRLGGHATSMHLAGGDRIGPLYNEDPEKYVLFKYDTNYFSKKLQIRGAGIYRQYIEGVYGPPESDQVKQEVAALWGSSRYQPGVPPRAIDIRIRDKSADQLARIRVACSNQGINIFDERDHYHLSLSATGEGNFRSARQEWLNARQKERQSRSKVKVAQDEG